MKTKISKTTFAELYDEAASLYHKLNHIANYDSNVTRSEHARRLLDQALRRYVRRFTRRP